MPLYADIVLPLAQPTYTYAIKEGMELEVGDAVIVQFGRNKLYTGIVWNLHENRPDAKRIKTISQKLYSHPILTPAQMELWVWIADYYMCTLGEVMRSALPSLMKVKGDDEESINDRIASPRTERYICLSAEYNDLEKREELLAKLQRRSPKQHALIQELLSHDLSSALGGLPRRILSADSTVIRTCEKHKYITSDQREVEYSNQITLNQLPSLSEHQNEALAKIKGDFESKSAVMLHGITGSGKTEIYSHLAAQTLAQGGDVLYLVPEIVLSTQLVTRLERIFGKVTAYHSKHTDKRRAESYLRLLKSDGGELVIGARSAIFLPLNNLKLIIVDEEHDPSYKQVDPSPRYNARDCAVVLARYSDARVVLGSATPSIETWYNAQVGKYGAAHLTQRYGDSQPPQIIISDTIRAVKRGERRTHFNFVLLDKIRETIERGEQVMLFQNRRGFAPYVECDACMWSARCPQCNVSLTLHKHKNSLTCHYCNHSQSAPSTCPRCGKGSVIAKGFGTEKVEQEISQLIPEAVTVRLDRDSVTSDSALNAVIDKFTQKEANIMVGTQMITKGFDFAGVSLVGILNADNLLLSPNFRSVERAFQLMTQVAGRAGRREQVGTVIIQSSDPEHPTIKQVLDGNYQAFAQRELIDRELFNYPPFSRLINITLRHRDMTTLRQAIVWLIEGLHKKFGAKRVLGPATPPVDRIRGEYIVGAMLKIEAGASMARARELIRELFRLMQSSQKFRNVTIICDVDPQ